MKTALVMCMTIGAIAVACGGHDAGSVPDPKVGLTHVDTAELAKPAPDSFLVHMITSRGPIDVKFHRDWSPHGVDQLYYLFKHDFYDGDRFFRVLEGFMAQWGLNGDPSVSKAWDDRAIADDPVKKGNQRGVISFAMLGPNSRRTQLFVNYKDNSNLDAMGFAGVGEVVSGMPAADSLFKGYGEGAPAGFGPDQSLIEHSGNTYLQNQFAQLDSIVTAHVVQEWHKG